MMVIILTKIYVKGLIKSEILGECQWHLKTTLIIKMHLLDTMKQVIFNTMDIKVLTTITLCIGNKQRISREVVLRILQVASMPKEILHYLT